MGSSDDIRQGVKESLEIYYSCFNKNLLDIDQVIQKGRSPVPKGIIVNDSHRVMPIYNLEE